MRGLDLFSGIGGLAIALAPWVRPVAYCEIEPYARGVLLSRMADGGLPMAPIWDDVRTLKGADLPEIDIITGGFPCQDVSQAGARVGLDGERTGLYREVLRLTDECRPAFVFLENVRGIGRYVPRIIRDFAERGFVLRIGALAASDVGAPHIRDRAWFFGAHADRLGVGIEPRGGGQDALGLCGSRCMGSQEPAFWSTPTVNGNYNKKGLSKTSGDGLATQVAMWPTPRASADKYGRPRDDERGDLQAAVFRTPTASDHRGPNFSGSDSASANGLATQVGGQLNPTWVEWLMGYPLEWTVCADWATPSSRSKRARRSKSSPGSEVRNDG